ncbi:hypothetical protein L1887_48373 [Cichorium endivia]|nr:hypothetical protein L1887_48373 [Cichorium endivia]
MGFSERQVAGDALLEAEVAKYTEGLSEPLLATLALGLERVVGDRLADREKRYDLVDALHVAGCCHEGMLVLTLGNLNLGAPFCTSLAPVWEAGTLSVAVGGDMLPLLQGLHLPTGSHAARRDDEPCTSRPSALACILSFQALSRGPLEAGKRWTEAPANATQCAAKSGGHATMLGLSDSDLTHRPSQTPTCKGFCDGAASPGLGTRSTSAFRAEPWLRGFTQPSTQDPEELTLLEPTLSGRLISTAAREIMPLVIPDATQVPTVVGDYSSVTTEALRGLNAETLVHEIKRLQDSVTRPRGLRIVRSSSSSKRRQTSSTTTTRPRCATPAPTTTATISKQNGVVEKLFDVLEEKTGQQDAQSHYGISRPGSAPKGSSDAVPMQEDAGGVFL